MYALLVFVISEGDGFFLGSCFAVAGVVGVAFPSFYCYAHKKSHSFSGVGFLILDFSIYILSFTCNCSGNYLVNATATY